MQASPPEAVTLLVALAVPVVTPATLVGLINGVTEVEHSRDELSELGVSRR